MNYFFITVLQAFLPVVLCCGLNWVRRPVPGLRALVWLNLLALTAGIAAGHHLPAGQLAQLLLVVSEGVVVVVCLLGQFSRSLSAGAMIQAILIAGAAMHWSTDPNLSALTPTGVINTELLLNLSAVVLAIALLALIASLVTLLVRRCPALRWPLLLLLAVMLLLPLSGQAMLLMMKLSLSDLTKTRLSFVAQVTNNSRWLNYLGAMLLVLMAAACLPALLRLRAGIQAQRQAVARRKATAQYRDARRSMLVMMGAAAVVGSGQLYWDLIASRPPRLSEALEVKLSPDGQLHIPIDKVRDGKLHRFVWIADDGKAVRFFVINRYPDRLRLGVVFDACLLCGDQGYVMEGNQVICVACGVHIFIPSIGKPGGCNPIPIDDWHNDEVELVVSKPALQAGVNYFTTVVTLNVADPVDGTRLTNISAEHKYSYGGKLYFFASEANYNRFRSQPTAFVAAAASAPEDE